MAISNDEKREFLEKHPELRNIHTRILQALVHHEAAVTTEVPLTPQERGERHRLTCLTTELFRDISPGEDELPKNPRGVRRYVTNSTLLLAVLGAMEKRNISMSFDVRNCGTTTGYCLPHQYDHLRASFPQFIPNDRPDGLIQLSQDELEKRAREMDEEMPELEAFKKIFADPKGEAARLRGLPPPKVRRGP